MGLGNSDSGLCNERHLQQKLLTLHHAPSNVILGVSALYEHCRHTCAVLHHGRHCARERPHPPFPLFAMYVIRNLAHPMSDDVKADEEL